MSSTNTNRPRYQSRQPITYVPTSTAVTPPKPVPLWARWRRRLTTAWQIAVWSYRVIKITLWLHAHWALIQLGALLAWWLWEAVKSQLF